MKRLWTAAAAIACGLAGILLWARPEMTHRQGLPLWPGAPYTEEDRDRAVERGLRFIYSMARDPAVFNDWGHDLLFAFQNIAETNANSRVAVLAWNMGHERAIEWRRLNRRIPPGSSIWNIATMAFGSDNADHLGVPDPGLDEQLRNQLARFSSSDYLGFDPAREPPPADLPEPCHVCGLQNARGAQFCARCNRKLTMNNRYALLMDALVATYSGEHFGTSLGGRYGDVLRWRPGMRPYPAHDYSDWNYYDAVYAVTHVVYTFNHYNLSRIAPGCFPTEFEYLRSNLPAAIRDHDLELLGEYVDSLRAFGLSYDHAPLREAVGYYCRRRTTTGVGATHPGRTLIPVTTQPGQR